MSRRKGKGGGGDNRFRWFKSIKDEHLPTVRWGLTHGGFNPVATENNDGRTALQMCCAMGKLRPLEMILDQLKRLRELNTVYTNIDDVGRTVLMMAAANGHFDCVRVLSDYQGLNRKWWSTKDNNGKTARDYALARRHTDIVSFFDGTWVAPKEIVVEETEEDIANKAADIAKYGTKKVDMTKCSTRSLRAAGVLNARDVNVEVEDIIAEAPEPIWSEVKVCLDAAKLPDHRDWKRDLLVERRVKPTVVDDETTETELSQLSISNPPDFVFDPALWFCTTVQVLKLQLPVGALSGIPSSISQLKSLTTLIITGNGLSSLPAEIGCLKDLKIIEAAGNSFETLPEDISKCSKLEVLELSNNKLISLVALKGLTNLVSLHADCNNLQSLEGVEFDKLKRLVDLSVSHNKIDLLPETIGECSSLQTLNLASNQLTSVPASLGNLGKKKLVKLLVSDCPIKDPKLKKNLKKAEKGAKDLSEALKFVLKNGDGGGKGGKGKKGKGKKGRR